MGGRSHRESYPQCVPSRYGNNLHNLDITKSVAHSLRVRVKSFDRDPRKGFGSRSHIGTARELIVELLIPDWLEGGEYSRNSVLPVLQFRAYAPQVSACCQIGHVPPGTNILGIKSWLPIRAESSAPRTGHFREQGEPGLFQVSLVRARHEMLGQSISGPSRPFVNVAQCEQPDPGRQTISEFPRLCE